MSKIPARARNDLVSKNFQEFSNFIQIFLKMSKFLGENLNKLQINGLSKF